MNVSIIHLELFSSVRYPGWGAHEAVLMYFNICIFVKLFYQQSFNQFNSIVFQYKCVSPTFTKLFTIYV